MSEANADLAARVEALERRLQQVEDERALERAFYRYNRVVNYGGDVDAFRRVFSEDALVDVFFTNGETVHRDEGVVAIHAHRAALTPPAIPDKHLMLAPLMDVRGDDATVENYFVQVGDDGQGGLIRSYGRSNNAFVREGDRWLLRERKAETESVRRS